MWTFNQWIENQIIIKLVALTVAGYYNNIDSLEELKRLRHNPNLNELDLRLNPITRSEPDSRLYLIHMLPNLQKLGLVASHC